MMRPPTPAASLMAAALLLNACGGGAVTSGSAPPPPPPPTMLYSVPAAQALSAADVGQVIAQAVGEATARGAPASIAVTDRVGNVLAVYQMAGAPTMVTIKNGPDNGSHGLQGATVSSTVAAIAKGVTGAYLSSGGNAFSTRTASEIIQTTFPPGQVAQGLGSGPLYGVQFSALPCSDLAQRFTPGAMIGPQRSPLGLAGDPGGFPLYKNGVLVGGVGVEADGAYGVNLDVLHPDPSQTSEEAIALAGTIGFDAPAAIRADQISVGGTLLIYSDATPADFKSNPTAAPGFGTLPAAGLVAVTGYTSGPVRPGVAYGSPASGIRKSTAAEFDNPDAFVLAVASGADRYPVRGGTETSGSPLTSAEVNALLSQAFATMSQTRAQIRQPLNSRAQVTISVVDTNGAVLGLVRSPDAPVFGIDVSLQKARTAMFFSGPFAAGDLASDGDAASVPGVPTVADYAPKLGMFLDVTNPLTGATAFSARSIGNLERPQFPDGQVGGPNGPFSLPITQFNPFDTGLQLDFIKANVMAHVGYVMSHGATPDTAAMCGPAGSQIASRLANGVQIFPGGVPVFRGGVLVGGIGVSGDGVNQDDLISFLGADGAATQTHSIGNAPPAIRADQLVINQGGAANRLLYVQCPVGPFLNSSVQNPCDGK